MILYEYASLTPDQSMRILTILPGDFPSEIHCQLEPRRKGQACEYDALSYTWGDDKPTKSIQIISQNQPFTMSLIPNLEAALRQLRHPERNVVLWVDAICINQADSNEKSHQVPKMAEIYSEASNVRVWLGEEEKNRSQLAISFIHRIIDLGNFDRLVADELLVEHWAALLSLMKRPWFGRRWVVQEIALAKRAYLHCGKSYISWGDFADAMRLFEQIQETIEEHFLKSSFAGFRSDLVADIKAMSATRLVRATSSLFRKSNDGQILECLTTLETLVSDLSPFEASDPRDVIYGVLALAKDTKITGHLSSRARETASSSMTNTTSSPSTPRLNNTRKRAARGSASKAKRQRRNVSGTTINSVQASPASQQYVRESLTPRDRYLVRIVINTLRKRIAEKAYDVDYTKSIFTVCKDFLKFVIRRSENLDILCRPWAPTNLEEDELPSWIPKVSGDGFGKRGDGSFVRVNADPLVGGAGNMRQNYSAPRSYRAIWSFGDWTRHEDPKSLRVTGFVLDTIGKITKHPAMSGDIPAEWPGFAGWTNATANPPKSFWMTLIAGRGLDGLSAPPDHYQRACKYAFTKKVAGGPLDVRYLIRDPAFSSIAKEFLKRMQSVVWMRRLIVTAARGILGLVPDDSQQGDCVCIMFGCSVPVVLREHAHTDGTASHFEFVGECYVDGMMDGEAMDQVRAEEYRTFVLR